MRTQNIKTVILILLIAGVVVQTGKLWFEESSGHNFFSIFPSLRSRTVETRYKIEPERIMVNPGNGKYIRLSQENATDIGAISDNHISEMIAKGNFMATAPLDWNSLLEQKAVVYEYPLRLSAETFARSYGQSPGDFKSRVSGFDGIVVKPARTSSESMRFYVVDSFSEEMYIFETQKGVSEPLSKEIDSLRGEYESAEDSITYISSVVNSIDFFTKNIYLAEWQAPSLPYTRVYVTNPFEEAGAIEQYVQLFFDNPVGLLSGTDPGGAPFVSDKDAVVKYYAQDGILEYTSYKAPGAAQASFDTCYTAAKNFMKRDTTLQNNVLLTAAKLDNNQWTLFFDYSWNGLGAFITSGHGLEITVSGGQVTKYRRIVKRLDRSELYGQFNESFIAALDRYFLEEGSEKLDRLELAYNISESGFCEITWFFGRDGMWSVD